MSETAPDFPRLKPAWMPCPCGCGESGPPRARAWNDGLEAHVRRCPCRRCRATRYKNNASRRERKIGKDLGARRNPGSGAWGGSDILGAVCEIEETSNVSLLAGFKRWVTGKGFTTKTAVIHGQTLKPAAFIASWDGKPRWAIMRYQDFVNLCERADG